MNDYFKKSILFLLLCSMLITIGCQRTSDLQKATGFYFNTVVSFTFYNAQDAKYADDCLALCEKYEQLFSRTVKGSDIWNINHANGQFVTVDEETLYLLETALSFCEQTDGKIDITVAPLMDLWNFTGSDTAAPPSKEQIDELLSHVNYQNIVIEGNQVKITDPEAAIDLGFVAKGYVADRLKELLIQNKVSSAIIDLGGNILTIGSKPDGSSYNIGIQTPFAMQNTPIATISVTDSSVVTSGIYERYFMYNDTCYHHILNTQTGYPVDNSLYGVTILSSSSMLGDAYSTTCLILGLDEGMKLINDTEGVEAVFITSDNELHYSNQY